MENRDEDLRHIVQSYEIKLNKAQFAITNEAKMVQDLADKKIEYKNSKRKLMTSVARYEESVQKGELLIKDIDEEIKTLMTEKQKDRIT